MPVYWRCTVPTCLRIARSAFFDLGDFKEHIFVEHPDWDLEVYDLVRVGIENQASCYIRLTTPRGEWPGTAFSYKGKPQYPSQLPKSAQYYQITIETPIGLVHPHLESSFL
jgi:hypothetical protein